MYAINLPAVAKAESVPCWILLLLYDSSSGGIANIYHCWECQDSEQCIDNTILVSSLCCQ